MDDPYAVLDLPADSDDEQIRRRYLELVRENPPERAPERFGQIRAAYEDLKDLRTRLHYRLFEAGKKDSIEAMVEELSCQSGRRRVPLRALLANIRRS